ncbi:AAA family ATPase [Microbacteriaceae bacterium VKM Ac-2855]|nr:AAA family ATPase [Microbacteriaceae bacterium VKM Ac-2855]
MAQVLHRPIGNTLLTAQGAPVVILEGARAVGKTTLMRNQIEPAGYSYATLADPTTLRFASADPAGWLRQLRRPAIIDEAQLLPDLPILLKEMVDQLSAETHFILTGSASIGRTGLGGADPLTRRSRRLSMSPLTQWEIAAQPGSLVDALFDSEVLTQRYEDTTDQELLNQMQIGGFPSYVYPDVIRTRRQSLEQIRSDIIAALSDAALPSGGYDSTIARTALDGLLRSPGGIFNASKMGQRLDLDRRTVDRYLGMFERLFLLHWIPNLATTAANQSHARSKIHPVDTSFSVESFARAGIDVLTEREQFGALVESHVVNQVIASAQWSDLQTDQFFWRQASSTSPEVDLVLVDGVGRHVGIEVKASRTLHPRDMAPLQALERERGLHRGFIFYTGTEVLQLDTNIWAMPMTSLSTSTTFAPTIRPPERANTVTSPTATLLGSNDATMFLSYVHADNERSGGKMVQFAKDLVETYAFLFGRTIELFVDRDSINWGETWSKRLQTEAESTSFMLAIVTPRYLQSEACRRELLAFSAAAEAADEPKLLLPLQWVDIKNSHVVDPEDPVLAKILSTHFVDATEVRRLQPGSPEYDSLLEEVANRLRQTVDQGATAGKKPESTKTRRDDRDLIELMEAVEGRQEDFQSAVTDFKDAFGEIGAVFRDRPPLRTSQTYATAKAMADVGNDLREPVAHLESATTELGKIWQLYDSTLARVARIMSDVPDQSSRTQLFESLDGLVRTLQLPGADTMQQQLHTMGNFSRHLRPMSHAVDNAFKLLSGIQASARSWRDQLTN